MKTIFGLEQVVIEGINIVCPHAHPTNSDASSLSCQMYIQEELTTWVTPETKEKTGPLSKWTPGCSSEYYLIKAPADDVPSDIALPVAQREVNGTQSKETASSVVSLV